MYVFNFRPSIIVDQLCRVLITLEGNFVVSITASLCGAAYAARYARSGRKIHQITIPSGQRSMIEYSFSMFARSCKLAT